MILSSKNTKLNNKNNEIKYQTLLEEAYYKAIIYLYCHRSLDFTPLPKQLEFLELTAKCKFSAFFAGNGCGKTEFGLQIVKALSTGIYPPWWVGRKFDGPTKGIIIKRSSEQQNAHIKPDLIGDFDGLRADGDKMSVIHKKDIYIAPNKKSEVDKSNVLTIKYQGSSKEKSKIYFRSYEQKAEKIDGYNVNWIWIDETVGWNYYTRLIKRLREKDNNFLFITATPERKGEPLYESFVRKVITQDDGTTRILEIPANSPKLFPNEKFHHGYIRASWKDNPYLSEEQKEAMRAMFTPSELSIAEHGIPTGGVDFVFSNVARLCTRPHSEVLEMLHPHLVYFIGVDPGFTDATGIVFMAYDTVNDIIIVFDEYKRSGLRPDEHICELNKANLVLTDIIYKYYQTAEWYKVASFFDVSSANNPIGITPKDIETVLKQYRHFGKMNAHLSGKRLLKDVRRSLRNDLNQRSETNRLIISDKCQGLLYELPNIKYDEQGKLIKGDDHLVDGMQYGVLNKDRATTLYNYFNYTEFKTRYVF